MSIKQRFLTKASARIDLNDIDRILISHGIDVLISDGSNYLCALLLSLLFKTTALTVLYLFVFGSLRVHTGGAHADTRFKCFIVFQCLHILFLLLMHLQYPPILLVTAVLLCNLYMLHYSPVEHIYNPLSDEERIKNQKHTRFYLLLFDIIFAVTINGNTMIPEVIAIVFIYNTALMERLKRSKYWRIS